MYVFFERNIDSILRKNGDFMIESIRAKDNVSLLARADCEKVSGKFSRKEGYQIEKEK